MGPPARPKKRTGTSKYDFIKVRHTVAERPMPSGIVYHIYPQMPPLPPCHEPGSTVLPSEEASPIMAGHLVVAEFSVNAKIPRYSHVSRISHKSCSSAVSGRGFCKCGESWCHRCLQVKVWLGADRDHYYILSRFLICRMLTVTRIPYIKVCGGH